MKNQDIDIMWKNYSQTLDAENISNQTLNKILSTKAKKSIFRINFYRYSGFSAFILLILFWVMYYAKNEESITYWLGTGIIFLTLIYYFYFQVVFFKKTKSLTTSLPVAEFEEKLLNLRKFLLRFNASFSLIGYILFLSGFYLYNFNSFEKNNLLMFTILYVIFGFVIFAFVSSRRRKFIKYHIETVLDELKNLKD